MHRHLLSAIVAVALFGMARPAHAEDLPSYKLQLQTDPKLPGKIRIIEGQAGQPADRFFLEGLGVLQPIAVTIIAKHKGDEIDVAFGQDRWDETVQKAATSTAKDEVTTKFRTQGDLKISVSANGDPKPYWLVVWVGDAVEPQMAPVVMPMKQYKQQHPEGAKGAVSKGAAGGGGTSPVMILIAVALVAIVLLLAVIAFRKKGKS